MKKRNGWLYAFWILIIVILILALSVGLISWAGSGTEESTGDGTAEENPDDGDQGGDSGTVSDVSVDPTEMGLTSEGEIGTIVATVTMTEGAYEGSYSWSSDDSDESVIELTSDGDTATVTAVATGMANVTVTVGEGDDAKSATCTVSVDISEPATVSDVALSQYSLALEYGGTAGSLTAIVMMSDDSDYEGDYTWESSDDSVASISGTGATVSVTAGKCGETAVTVSVGEDDNIKIATCGVTVSEDHTAAEAGRLTGSADVEEGYNFTFDSAEKVAANEAVLFDDSAVSATYDSDEQIYTLSGLSGIMTSDQSTAFWGNDSHVGHEYIGFIVNVNAGESIDVTTYTGASDETKEKDVTFASPDEDTSFILDLEDHADDGDWRMVLDVTYAGGDVETYTVVLGEIFAPASTATDLSAIFASGGNVALTDDITVSSPVQVAEGAEVELDLAGHTVGLNDSTYNINYTIGVSIGAELTIIDSSEDGSGVVDTVGNNTAALINVGTTILKGGLFTRSQEAGMEETGNGVGSFYTVVNIGDMVIEDGTTVYNAGDYSSCLVNSNGSDVQAVYPNSRTESANLTINGGKIFGGKYSIRNGGDGTLTMTGGTVGGLRSADDTLPYRAINNYDEATITGGTLLGGNGGAIDVNAGGHANNCTEGVVIFNEDGGTNHTLTIGDESGNGPEIIYEGINADADNNEIDESSDEDATTDFATGIAIESGEVDIQGGTIECSDTDAEKGYTFMGVYLTNGELNVLGGKISGDEALVIDCASAEGASVEAIISGGILSGTIVAYAVADENGEAANPLTFEGYEAAGYTLTTETSGDGGDTAVSRYVYTQAAATD